MFQISYGLSGGFGGCGDWEDCPYVSNMDKAMDAAYEAACEEYDSYDGLHGLESREDIAEENPEYPEDAIEEVWRESRESWLDYRAREVPNV